MEDIPLVTLGGDDRTMGRLKRAPRQRRGAEPEVQSGGRRYRGQAGDHPVMPSGVFLQEARVTFSRNDGHGLMDLGAIRSSRDVYETVRPLVSWDREVLIPLFLSVKNKVLGYEISGVGGIGRCTLFVGPMLRTALLVGAAALVLVHNHPSLDPQPSAADRIVTETVFKAAEAVEITLLDHVIVGDGRWYSFGDEGVIDQLRAKRGV